VIKRDMWHIWGRGKVYTGFRWGNLRDRDHLEDPGIDGRIILRWNFRNWDMRLLTGSSWRRIETGGGHLLMRQRTFGFQEMRGMS